MVICFTGKLNGCRRCIRRLLLLLKFSFNSLTIAPGVYSVGNIEYMKDEDKWIVIVSVFKRPKHKAISLLQEVCIKNCG